MNSAQNLLLLQNLYRLKAIGYSYSDPFVINKSTNTSSFKNIEALKQSISNCFLCDLSKSRRQSMSGFGNQNASLMIVDYSVSLSDNDSNSYYTGRSGEMLRAMIEKVLELSVDDVFITHAVKCKTLNQKEPTASEWDSCKNYLFAQIELIQPKMIITLGKEAYAKISGDEKNFHNARGHIIDYKNYKLVPIYHPNHLLLNPQDRAVALRDLKIIKSYL